MTALLHAEFLKLRTTRTAIGLAGAAVGISLLLTALVATLTRPSAESVLVDVFASDTSSFFILIFAVVGISGEWRHHTITSSLLAAPDRVRFLAAKTLAFAAAGLLLSLAISVTVSVLGFAILSFRDLPTPELGDLADLVSRNALAAALLGAFGVGVGAIVRNQIVGVVGILVFAVLVEPLVLGLAPDVGRFGPLVALPTATVGLPPEESGLGDVDLLASGLAALALFAWISAVFAAGALLLRHRDVD